MKTSGIIEGVDDAPPFLGTIQEKVVAELALLDDAPPPEVIGDLLLLLAAPHPVVPERDGEPEYRYMLSEILRGARWQRLRHRLARRVHTSLLEERNKVALQFLASTLSSQLSQHHGAAASAEGGSAREAMAEAYCDSVETIRDKSEYLADDYALLMAEFARRGFSYQFLTAVLDRQLVELCLAAHWNEPEYKARELVIVHLPGTQEERLPGDLFGVRGVTVKTREDQIREILPSEFAPWSRNEKGQEEGRWLTMDKIINRNPVIFEHFNTTRPLSRHRILVVLSAASERSPQHEVALGAELWARVAVFYTLFALARRVPHDQVKVDVALFTRESERWDGAFFPLDAVPVRDTAWRNILELDELHPSFFALHKGRTSSTRRNVEFFSAPPSDRIGREQARGVYQAIVVANFCRPRDRRSALPSPSLSLPRIAPGVPLVLLGTVDDEGWDQDEELAHEDLNTWERRARRRAAMYRRVDDFRGGFFPDLLSAHLAPMPLAKLGLHQMTDGLLEMVIGPRKESVTRSAP